MKDFNIAKYLKENHLGSHGILGRYVDLHGLKEDKDLGQQEAMPEPYEGDGHPIDGLGGKLNRHMDVSMNEEDMEEEVSVSSSGVEMEEGWSEEQDKYDRMMGLAHEYFEKVSPIVRKTIDALRNDGFDDQDILDFMATDFSQIEESINESESYFQNDMTVVSDPNAYTVDDFAEAAGELQSNRFDVEYDQEGIVVHDKKTKSNISFDYSDNSWTATFEDGMTPSADSVKMDLDEFIEEVQSWKAWSNQNRI